MSGRRGMKAAGAQLSSGDPVFCLEGDWDERGFQSRLTVEHLLRLMQEAGSVADYTHRDVATREELTYYLSRLQSIHRFKVIYLAFHGTEDGLDLSHGTTINLDELADLADGAFKDAAVHLGSCAVIAQQSAAELARFCRRSGARLVSGYRNDVAWIPSAMLDMAVLNVLAQGWTAPRVFKAMAEEHPGLTESLALRVASRGYDSGSV